MATITADLQDNGDCVQDSRDKGDRNCSKGSGGPKIPLIPLWLDTRLASYVPASTNPVAFHRENIDGLLAPFGDPPEVGLHVPKAATRRVDPRLCLAKVVQTSLHEIGRYNKGEARRSSCSTLQGSEVLNATVDGAIRHLVHQEDGKSRWYLLKSRNVDWPSPDKKCCRCACQCDGNRRREQEDGSPRGAKSHLAHPVLSRDHPGVWLELEGRLGCCTVAGVSRGIGALVGSRRSLSRTETRWPTSVHTTVATISAEDLVATRTPVLVGWGERGVKEKLITSLSAFAFAQPTARRAPQRPTQRL